MFLDDKLYNHLQEAIDTIELPSDVNRVYNELLQICNAEIKVKMPAEEPPIHIIKATLDRIFNSWDSFAKRLVKEKHAFGDICTKQPFKWVFLKDERMNEIYKKLTP